MISQLRGRTRPSPSILAVVALTFALGACATGGSTPGEQRSPSPAERVTRVQVDNRHTSDVVVYALAQGQYYRLGNVTAHQQSNLTLARHLENASGVRLVADPIGSRSAFFSQQILFSPGDVLLLDIGPSMNLSSVSVRSGSR